MNLTLDPGVSEQMLQHAVAVLPAEGCGLIAGVRGRGVRFVAIQNILESATAYEMDPPQLIAALRSFRDSNEELVAICHSHPRGPAHPSATDIERAFYPEAAHIIVSLEHRDRPVIRGFRIVDREVIEVDVRVIV